MAAAESGSAVGIAAVCDVLDAAVKRAEEREAAEAAAAKEENGDGNGEASSSSSPTPPPPAPPSPPPSHLSPLARRGSAAALSEPGLLAMAAMHGTRPHLEALEELLLRGADCLTPNARGDNALHAAARAGRSASLRALLSSRVVVSSSSSSSPSASEGDGEAQPQQPQRVARLGDLVVPRDSWAGSSSSSPSSSSSSQPATRLVDARGPHGLSPLDLAVLSGSAPSVSTLVRGGGGGDGGFGERGCDFERKKTNLGAEA